ncbi:MAG: hypothetical protein IPM74_10295 [Crocinitomicaceae bacterium]|nr:hypothetical protein [Crocinitomicaceae bacterium]MBK8926282.1 hypothetical protein [Crocinitomicaceae bacterium]
MNTSALIMMLVTEITIACVTGYFFYRVLTTKKHEEPDSFTENDDQE